MNLLDRCGLYFGDCLEVMREFIPDNSVDLIYLDPPFNSKRIYNAFIGGAQWVAFEDTWRWFEAVDDFDDVVRRPGTFSNTLEGLRKALDTGSNLAYLSYMANRLRECHRVLKPTGSIYLHCDPTMSHYLKIVMDGLFGRKQFQNEFIWYYSGGGASKKRWARKHDVVLYYSKGREWTFNLDAVRVPRKWNKGQRRADGSERDARGKIPDDVWRRHSIVPWSSERIGYDTQKPLALLKRLVMASSNPGDMVLDPFCGGGTTIHAAHELDRRWIGIDICVTACQTIEERLSATFEILRDSIEFVGFPKTIDDARILARKDPARFQRWAASLVQCVEANPRLSGDKGIDGFGRLAIARGEFIDIVCQVKGGQASPEHVRAFDAARRQAEAELGIFTCFEDRVTPGMRDVAADAGKYRETNIPRIQSYTLEDYFAGRKAILPHPVV